MGDVAAGGVAGPALQPIPIGHELSGTVIAAGSAGAEFIAAFAMAAQRDHAAKMLVRYDA